MLGFWSFVLLASAAIAGAVSSPFIVQWLDEQNKRLTVESKLKNKTTNVYKTTCCGMLSKISSVPHKRDLSKLAKLYLNPIHTADSHYDHYKILESLHNKEQPVYERVLTIPVLILMPSHLPQLFRALAVEAAFGYHLCIPPSELPGEVMDTKSSGAILSIDGHLLNAVSEPVSLGLVSLEGPVVTIVTSLEEQFPDWAPSSILILSTFDCQYSDIIPEDFIHLLRDVNSNEDKTYLIAKYKDKDFLFNSGLGTTLEHSSFGFQTNMISFTEAAHGLGILLDQPFSVYLYTDYEEESLNYSKFCTLMTSLFALPGDYVLVRPSEAQESVTSIIVHADGTSSNTTKPGNTLVDVLHSPTSMFSYGKLKLPGFIQKPLSVGASNWFKLATELTSNSPAPMGSVAPPPNSFVATPGGWVRSLKVLGPFNHKADDTKGVAIDDLESLAKYLRDIYKIDLPVTGAGLMSLIRSGSVCVILENGDLLGKVSGVFVGFLDQFGHLRAGTSIGRHVGFSAFANGVITYTGDEFFTPTFVREQLLNPDSLFPWAHPTLENRCALEHYHIPNPILVPGSVRDTWIANLDYVDAPLSVVPAPAQALIPLLPRSNDLMSEWDDIRVVKAARSPRREDRYKFWVSTPWSDSHRIDDIRIEIHRPSVGAYLWLLRWFPGIKYSLNRRSETIRFGYHGSHITNPI